MASKKINVGYTLESIRFERGVTKKEDFAKLCGVSRSRYSILLKGDATINLSTLEDICKNLQISLFIFVFKSVNEGKDKGSNKTRLVREIEPLVEKASEVLYPT